MELKGATVRIKAMGKHPAIGKSSRLEAPLPAAGVAVRACISSGPRMMQTHS